MGPVPKPLIAGNWKMNGMRGSLAQIKEIAASNMLASGKFDALIDRVPWNGVARLIIELSGQGREWVNLRLAS
ncbi:hypothetical protein JZX87_18905 [Agrobacterium sp. Ap1]|nr:hypothetical protein [Agrobacterium sp. Ap1]